jgi:putative membrane protein
MNETRPDSPAHPEDPRVRFAAERTLLAWIRTGIAMMGFGFVVARFGLFLREFALAEHDVAHQRSTGWSLGIGVALIGLGVVVNVLTSYEYFRIIRSFYRGRDYAPRTALMAVFVAMILALLGIAMAVYLVVINP